MQLNLQKRKNFSEDNMRRIINLIIGISSQTSQLQDQCLTDYDETRVYSAGNITIYDGYIWEAKTVATGTWDSSKWTKIGTDDITELDLDTIKSYLNLTPEQITNLQSLIDDTAITTTKTNSSSKIYMDIQAAITECKNDTLKQIAKKVSGSYKIAASTSDVTSADFIYLINNGVNYDLYVLVDSVPTRVGDTSVNFDNYYTKTETDSDFLKKTDATSTYATITTVDGKVDKTSIATAISSTPSVDKVASEKAVYDKNTINHKIIQGIDILDYASKVVDNFEFVRGFNVINSPYGDNDSPNNDMLYMINRISVSGYCRLIAYDLRSTFAYMRTQLNSTWTDWVRLTVAGGTKDYQTLATPQIKDGAYMSNSILWGTDRDFIVFDINKPDKTVRRLQFDTVEKAIGMYDLDYSTNAITEVGTLRFQKTSYVPPTDVTFTSPNVSKARENEVCKYCVKNGVCYVTLNDLSFSSDYKSEESFVVLPKPAMRQDFELTDSLGTTVLGKLFLEEHGAMHLYTNTTPVTATGYISFSYPVAE